MALQHDLVEGFNEATHEVAGQMKHIKQLIDQINQKITENQATEAPERNFFNLLFVIISIKCVENLGKVVLISEENFSWQFYERRCWVIPTEEWKLTVWC